MKEFTNAKQFSKLFIAVLYWNDWISQKNEGTTLNVFFWKFLESLTHS